ncbi:MAG: hypothetical protein H6686_10465 [Fibrobacteria bacterium]|nr:hypothetical protein [Fibrobacteria bacterium]
MIPKEPGLREINCHLLIAFNAGVSGGFPRSGRTEVSTGAAIWAVDSLDGLAEGAGSLDGPGGGVEVDADEGAGVGADRDSGAEEPFPEEELSNSAAQGPQRLHVELMLLLTVSCHQFRGLGPASRLGILLGSHPFFVVISMRMPGTFFIELLSQRSPQIKQ